MVMDADGTRQHQIADEHMAQRVFGIGDAVRFYEFDMALRHFIFPSIAGLTRLELQAFLGLYFFLISIHSENFPSDFPGAQLRC